MTRPAGATIPRYWSPWRWAPAARTRWAWQGIVWAFPERVLPAALTYQGA